MELNEELTKLINEIKDNNKFYPFNIIYLRLSKLDNKLTPKEAIKEAISKLRADFNGLLEKYPNLKEEGFLIKAEVKSAYKNDARDEFETICENYLFNDVSVIDILKIKKDKSHIKLYVASYDRLSRIFLFGLMFQLLRKHLKINIFSLLEDERVFEETNKNILEADNMQQTLYIFQLILFSNSASKHSDDLSVKIKKRVGKGKVGTISTKTGKKWGASKTISEKMRNKVRERLKRFTAQEVSEQKDIFQDLDEDKKDISVHTIYKLK